MRIGSEALSAKLTNISSHRHFVVVFVKEKRLGLGWVGLKLGLGFRVRVLGLGVGLGFRVGFVKEVSVAPIYWHFIVGSRSIAVRMYT